MSKIIGIDLGTTYSCAAVAQSGQMTIIPNALGARLTPSVVQILPSGEAIVGEHALQHRFLDPRSTITGIKRLIGRRYNEVVDIVRTLPYEVCLAENNLAAVRVRDTVYTPQFISALLLDVTPASLGLEGVDGDMVTMIPRNSTIPTKKTELFSTVFDNQSLIEIHVLQGEYARADGNRSLGRCVLDRIPPAPKHTPKIAVTFDIDANGILNVSAKDMATGREVKTTILPSTGLNRRTLQELAQVTTPIRPV